MTMTHPGLPMAWALPVFVLLGMLALWLLWIGGITPAPAQRKHAIDLARVPGLNKLLAWFTHSPWPLFILKVIAVSVFLLVITAGLSGSPIPGRNFATAFTWTLWWTLLIISIFFIGSAWCAVCPWDALASWLVKRRLWRRNDLGSLQLRVPKSLRNIWPATAMFIGLTWLELGVGITQSPYGTALTALFIVVVTTVSMSLFERKAFCRYFCPVGRTIGAYAQLAPIELRPIKQLTCDNCRTLDCYYGNEQVNPCPTHLLMGKLTQNTYCTSCGDCVMSCPHDNISWRLRGMGSEAMSGARPHWDEAWFMLMLLSLSSFHGVTMMPFWGGWISSLAQHIGDSGQLLMSFSIGIFISMLIPITLFALMAWSSGVLMKTDLPFRRLFSGLSFISLPLAFSYHIAHNLNHLVNEAAGLGDVLMNPLGTGTEPLSMAELHAKHLNGLLPAEILYTLQAAIMAFGVWLAILILRHRWHKVFDNNNSLLASRTGITILPMLLFITTITCFNMWLLMEPMVMRM